MAYFRNHSEPEKEHEQQFHLPVLTSDPISPQDEDWTDEQEARKDRYRLLFAVRDLFGTVLGALFILALLMLLVSLASWVIKDLSQSFSLLGGL
jgi:hypothetical protein